MDKNLIWTKIFSERRGSQTASVTYQIKMEETFLSRNLRFANSTQWGKAGRGIGLGGGAVQTPRFPLESFPLKVFSLKVFS